ncbi:preprotein translocase subunit SecG [Ferruginibacter sp. HRS2-29]|uniref:preprotein translocase subunit SecG n=1 Tax=Ferruginibacter sp. HRS2-29 TaxID=2487334 RepID=UPI0020CF4E7A|nr:preprotein translocase subunit SecG [Ferruginibacter sp. HRS2-29]MCP9751191.1 preprotein translocase subunit SecG [Ferruginibacter sp. HRS2-29]
MLALFGVLIIIASVVLGLIVLIQNPKGGGLSGALGGFGNQLMGVKQTTDVLEKGTWVFSAIVGILCLVSPAFISKDAAAGSKGNDLIEKTTNAAPKQQAPATTPATTPSATVPMPQTVDTLKK